MSTDKPRKPETDTVRMHKSIIRRLARIAAHRDQSVPDLFAEILPPIIEQLEAQMLADIRRERGQKNGDDPPPKKKS